MTTKSVRSVGRALLAVGFLCFIVCPAQAQVVLSEIMYHPVEQPVFDPEGKPSLDLSQDRHEFIEIHNPGQNPVDLTGWKITGDIDYRFPIGALIPPGAYQVVAKDKIRIASVEAYGLLAETLYGPYEAQLSNDRGTIKLKNGQGKTVDEVTYSATFPWPIGADALGVGEAWLGIQASDYQYRGRSLERVSFVQSPEDPANWLASPLPAGPSPGRANAVRRSVPLPIVVNLEVAQAADRQILIRSNQPVRIAITFSATNSLTGAALEYFVDDINLTNEVRTTVPMVEEESGRYRVDLPGQPNRKIVRYRIWANREGEDAVVSPRPGDPFSWHAYFITPVRTSKNDNYDLFISTKSIAQLSANLADNPNSGYLPAPSVIPNGRWNNEEPGVFVHNGVVRDVRTRYNGSFYRRSPDRQSYKVALPRYNPLNGQSTLLITDKDLITVVGHALFREAGLPTAHTRSVDLYVNGLGRVERLEIEESDERLLEAYHQEQAALHPGQPVEEAGRFFKSSGILDNNGPYGRGDGTLLKTNAGWRPIQRYEWVYSLKNDDWRGYSDLKELIDQMWLARGTRASSNVVQLRAYFQKYWDIDRLLTYVAVRNWMATWDDTVHNYFLWQRHNGKWTMLPWDFDADMGGGSAGPGTSIFRGEELNSDNVHDTHPFKDSFYKALREEYKQRLFVLNNTLLHPDNLVAMGFGSYRSWALDRMKSVNTQCRLGVFERPNRPTNQSPASALFVLPNASFRVSPYSHSTNIAPAHVSTTWRIRTVNGTYLDPVFSVTTSNALTELPIPFDQLSFGQAYYWQCIFHDAKGRPSLPSDETSFAYGSAGTPMKLLSLDSSTLWKYSNEGKLPASDWMQPEFNDSGWKSGAGLLGIDTGVLPEPIRTPLALGQTSYYFRVRFPFTGDPERTVLQLRHVVDDGAVFYLNGQEARRTRIAPGPGGYETIATSVVNNAVYEGPFQLPSGLLRNGDNVLAVEVHQASVAGGDLMFGASLDATVVGLSGDVTINEVMALNRSAVSNGGKNPDWIELFNRGSQTVDLSGLTLSDNPAEPAKFVFPAGTLLGPQSYLVVWCDGDLAAPGLHTGFGLSAEGQIVGLYRPVDGGYRVIDAVQFGLQVADLTIGRIPDGTGAWQLNTPSPTLMNAVQTMGEPNALRINEWLASPSSGEDWFELYNPGALPVALGGLYLTDDFNNRTNTRIADLSFIGVGGYAQFFADADPGKGAAHVNFKLSADGETLALYGTNTVYLIDRVDFGAQTKGVSQGRLPDGGEVLAFFAGTASPKGGNLVYQALTNVWVNEVLTHAVNPLEDAIELYNPTGAAVDVSHYWLSDDRNRLQKFRIPAGTTIAAGGFLVFYENQFNPVPGSATSFSLNAQHGDELYLSSGDAAGKLTDLRMSVKFGAAGSGVSLGRVATSVGVDYFPLSHRTFGADNPASLTQFRTGRGLANAAPQVASVVINEIMYHPPDLGLDGLDNTRDEFIEVFNPGPDAVPLFDSLFPTNTWHLGGEATFEFPSGLTLAPGSFLLVVAFDPADADTLAAFRTAYGLGPEVMVVGPYLRDLNNGGAEIELLRPDAPLGPGAEEGFVPRILVDRVRFTDGAPWPTPADGSGLSLQRAAAALYGNEPAHWFAATPTPGRNPVAIAPPSIVSQPDPQLLVTEGTQVQLRVTAAGLGPIGYQWRWNSYDIPGATENVLALNNVDSSRSGQYSVVVYNEAGFVVSSPSILQVSSLPVLLSQPISQTVSNGGNATFSVLVSTSGKASYQWFLNGEQVPGATASSLLLSNVGLAQFGDYRVRVTDRIGSVLSESASLRVIVRPVIIAQPQSIVAVVGDTVTFSVTVSPNHPSLPIGYRWRHNAITLQPNFAQVGKPTYTLTNVQLIHAGNYSVQVTNPAISIASPLVSTTAILTVLPDIDGDLLPDVWEIQHHFATNNPTDGGLDTDGDTVSNRDEYVAGTDPLDPASYLRLEAAIVQGAPRLGFLAVSNKTYTVEYKESLTAGRWTKLADVGNRSSNRVESVTDPLPRTEGRLYRLVTPQRAQPLNAKPFIVASPQSVRAASGATVQLAVQAIGQGPLQYQWRRDGGDLPGAKSSVLVLGPLESGLVGDYTVVVTDWGGSEETLPAQVSLDP